MCWNQDISLNTFIFGCFALVFIYIANTYTKYKSKFFDNPFVYLVFFLIVSMQLLEYFIWKNLKNISMNRFLSKVGFCLIVLQMFAFVLLVENAYSQRVLLVLLVLFVVTTKMYKIMYNPVIYRTTVGRNGHLSWDWLQFKGKEKIILYIGLLFYLIPSLLSKAVNQSTILLASIFLGVAYLISKEDNTYGSVWCWLINLLLLKEVISILIVRPFYEYNGLC